MDSYLSSDDSCDSEMKLMKSQLSEFGFEEQNLSKEEMCDLLRAFRNSKSIDNCSNAITSIFEEEVSHKDVNVDTNYSDASPNKALKRRFLNVRDRRMPWSLFSSTLTPAEKARTLAVYIKLMSINNYRQARQCVNFTTWPPPIQIVEETTRVQPVRSTRSGRTMPIYSGFEDDSTDLDFVVSKTKKRKISNSEQNIGDNTYSNKVVSLKRKPSKDENSRSVKEVKLNETNECGESTVGVIQDIFSLVED